MIKRNTYIVRAIIDTGSMKSYILKSAADKMGYSPTNEQVITHSLFGGVKSEAKRHHCYDITIGNLDGSYNCRFQAMDQDIICGDISNIKKGPWSQELRKLKIKLTDDVNDESPIQVLLGADIVGQLFTGNISILESGLAAMETYLGWTLMGKIPEKEQREDSFVTATSMFVTGDKVADLWSLDVLGIKDPTESKSQKEREDAVHKTFLDTVKVNGDGRYEVQLPWLECHPTINDNRNLAEKRLESTMKKLKAQGLISDYDNVFEEWKANGIIEVVP